MANATKPRTDRIYLQVPFWHAKDPATGKVYNKAARYVKKVGACYFDNKHKAYYTYAGAHSAKTLARFMKAEDREKYGF